MLYDYFVFCFCFLEFSWCNQQLMDPGAIEMKSLTSTSIYPIRSLWRQYWVVALVALVAWAVHASVDRKFQQMMRGLQEAAALKSVWRMDELLLLNDDREATLYHLASRRHIQDAYKKEYEAREILIRIRAEEMESTALHNTASKLENYAEEDEKKAGDLEYASIGDHIDYIASKLQGTVVEKRAEEEAAEASERLNRADELEKEGTELLYQAEAQLNATGTVSEVLSSHHGLCGWVSFACNSIDRTARTEYGQKTSSAAIAVAASFDEALKRLEEAKKEKDYAMKLLHNSANDVNVSIAILEEANSFREKADDEHLKAMELHEKAKKEKEEGARDEIIGGLEDKEIAEDYLRLISALNAYSRDVVDARAEAENATALEYGRQRERANIMEIEIRIRNLTYAAKKHVAHAGWYALLAVLLAVVLFVLLIFRIVGTCKTSEPWLWLLRTQCLEIRDISYIYNHFLLLILTMAFSGELLYDYNRHSILGRIEITTLFALVGSFFQVTLLHFIPNIVRLVSVSSLNTHTFLTLLLENVAKSGICVFILFLLEILLCWVNFGDSIFSRVYRLNGPWLWGFVAITGIFHVCFLENYNQHSTALERDHGTELRSLLDDSTRPVAPNSNSWSIADLSYGSTQESTIMSVGPEVASTFISSWATQLNRLMFLAEILLASWALWVVRYDMAIIFKLSPLAPRIIWGFFPLWVLDIILAALFAALAYLLFRWKRQKQMEIQIPRNSLESAGGYIASTPLLG